MRGSLTTAAALAVYQMDSDSM